MAFPLIDILGVVPATLLAAGRRIDRLAIDAGGGAGLVRFLRRADFRAQQIVDYLEGAVVPPLIKVAPHGGPGRKVLGQIPPMAAGAEDVKDGINDIAQIRGARSSAGIHGQVWLDQRPLLIRDVAGVGFRSQAAVL